MVHAMKRLRKMIHKYPLFTNTKENKKGVCVLKQIFVIANVTIVIALNFAMYCCLRVASKEDQMMEKFRREKEGDDD